MCIYMCVCMYHFYHQIWRIDLAITRHRSFNSALKERLKSLHHLAFPAFCMYTLTLECACIYQKTSLFFLSSFPFSVLHKKSCNPLDCRDICHSCLAFHNLFL